MNKAWKVLALCALLCLAGATSVKCSDVDDHGTSASAHKHLSESAECHDLLKDCPAWADQGLCDEAFEWHEKPVASHWCRSSCQACRDAPQDPVSSEPRGAAPRKNDDGAIRTSGSHQPRPASRNAGSTEPSSGSTGTVIVDGREYRLMPDTADALKTSSTRSADSDGEETLPEAAQVFYQWQADMELLSSGALDKLVEQLARVPQVEEALAAAGLSLEQLKALEPRLMLYWQRQMPELMELLRSASGSALPGLKDLLAAGSQLAKAFSKEAIEGALEPDMKGGCTAHARGHSSGSTAAPVDSKTATSISKRLGVDLEGIEEAVRDFMSGNWLDKHSNGSSSSSSRARGKARSAGGASLVIPIVFHILSHPFQASGNAAPMLGPKNALGETAIAAAQRWVDVLNSAFRNMNVGMQFTAQEVRQDPSQHAYLLLGDVAEYQGCLNDEQQCFGRLKASHSVDPTKVMNVWVFGYVNYARSPSLPACQVCYQGQQCGGCPLGRATLPDGDESAGHYVWMAYDTFDPDHSNNAAQLESGGNVFVHEVGHYLGLQHTFGNAADGKNAGCKADDGVDDTPINMNAQGLPWYNRLETEVCIPYRKGQLTREEAGNLVAQMGTDSCPNQPGLDNLWNFMSYVPEECMMMLSKGQIERMWAEVKLNRPRLFAASSVAK